MAACSSIPCAGLFSNNKLLNANSTDPPVWLVVNVNQIELFGEKQKEKSSSQSGQNVMLEPILLKDPINEGHNSIG